MEEERTQIKKIRFPNTIRGCDQNIYSEKEGYELKLIQKNGEMAAINWIEVTLMGKKYAEIKESICDVYFE